MGFRSILFDGEIRLIFCNIYFFEISLYIILYKGRTLLFYNSKGGHCKKRGFLDCGSYGGEFATAYMKFIGEECQVYAFGSDKENY